MFQFFNIPSMKSEAFKIAFIKEENIINSIITKYTNEALSSSSPPSSSPPPAIIRYHKLRFHHFNTMVFEKQNINTTFFNHYNTIMNIHGRAVYANASEDEKKDIDGVYFESKKHLLLFYSTRIRPYMGDVYTNLYSLITSMYTLLSEDEKKEFTSLNNGVSFEDVINQWWFPNTTYILDVAISDIDNVIRLQLHGPSNTSPFDRTGKHSSSSSSPVAINIDEEENKLRLEAVKALALLRYKPA